MTEASLNGENVILVYSFSTVSLNYGCLFVANLSWKNNFFLKKYVFYKIYIICRKNDFIWTKSFILKFFFLKKTFFLEKNIKWKCKKIYISFEKYIFMQEISVLQIKGKSFLNIYSFWKKIFLIIKNIFVKTSLWTQQSGL